MAKYVLSERDAARVERILRWFDRNKNLRDKFRKRNSNAGSGFVPPRIFSVQNITALGWGVYNCYEQVFDKDDWASTAAGNRFGNKNTDAIQVFNLLENYPVAGYNRALGRYDLLQAVPHYDDKLNFRWMGIPVVPPVRRFKTTEAATANEQITCNMILNNGVEAASADDIVYNVEVYVHIHGGAALDEALADLVSAGYLHAINEQGIWRCVGIFHDEYVCP